MKQPYVANFMYNLFGHPFGGVLTIASEFIFGITWDRLYFDLVFLRGLFGVIAYGLADHFLTKDIFT